MTCLIPFVGETHFTVPSWDFLLEMILEPRETKIQQPVMRSLRVIRRRYSDSELSSAANMLNKLRKGADLVSRTGVDQNEVLDVLLERFIDTL